MDKSSKIYVAGHRGMVGSALIRALRARGYENLVTRTRQQLDLLDQAAVRAFMRQEKPEYIFLAAAKVGGIHANNTYPADFLYENLVIEANIIHAAFDAAVQRLMFLGSSCIYPRDCAQPIREEYLLTGPLESTNEAYAIAKIAGLKLCESYNRQHGTRYVSVMPTNLYGPHDNFDLATSHVLPALLRKTHEAKMSNARALTIWGSGTPKREFLHVDDMAEACVYLMERDIDTGVFNVGLGTDVSIHDLARSIMRVVGYDGELEFDRGKPDGTPRKLLDVSKLAALGWQAQRSLEAGLRDIYAWYLAQPEVAKLRTTAAAQ
jgi:GDP-L-fucose synthase